MSIEPNDVTVRQEGDDVLVQLRVRRVNLTALEDGVVLGIDDLTGRPIELRLVARMDGTHDLQVITNAAVMGAAPEAVSPEIMS